MFIYETSIWSNNAAIQAAVDQSFILWDIDTLDWKNRNTASIMKEVRKAQPGSIILMHDIHQTSIDALPYSASILNRTRI